MRHVGSGAYRDVNMLRRLDYKAIPRRTWIEGDWKSEGFWKGSQGWPLNPEWPLVLMRNYSNAYKHKKVRKRSHVSMLQHMVLLTRLLVTLLFKDNEFFSSCHLHAALERFVLSENYYGEISKHQWFIFANPKNGKKDDDKSHSVELDSTKTPWCVFGPISDRCLEIVKYYIWCWVKLGLQYTNAF